MAKAKVVNLEPILSDAQVAKLAGTHLQSSDCKKLIQKDTDVYCSKTGRVLAKFRKNVIPEKIYNAAFEALKGVSVKLDNRGIAAGWNQKEVDEVVRIEGAKGYVRKEGSFRFQLIKADGTLSNTLRSTPARSAVVGYMDRSPRFPNCRQTAFNQKHLDKFNDSWPIMKLVDQVYEELMPEKYKLQKQEADKTNQDFIIKDTAFTTVTVNKNWQTAVHTDKGDFEKGFGNLTAIRKGRFIGGNLVLPKWGVGFDIHNGDLLLMDVNKWHGNNPIRKIDKDAVRVSLVMYYRKNMIHCGSAKDELEKVKRRKPGQKIND